MDFIIGGFLSPSNWNYFCRYSSFYHKPEISYIKKKKIQVLERIEEPLSQTLNNFLFIYL
jgi:hypothetical protein